MTKDVDISSSLHDVDLSSTYNLLEPQPFSFLNVYAKSRWYSFYNTVHWPIVANLNVIWYIIDSGCIDTHTESFNLYGLIGFEGQLNAQFKGKSNKPIADYKWHDNELICVNVINWRKSKVKLVTWGQFNAVFLMTCMPLYWPITLSLSWNEKKKSAKWITSRWQNIKQIFKVPGDINKM